MDADAPPTDPDASPSDADASATDAETSQTDSGSPSLAGFAAAQLAVVVAVVHVSLGLLNWIRWASAGFLVPRDLRWPAFVFTGVALLVGLLLAAQGRYRRPLYAGGIVLMVGYVVGYFGWHATGHRPLMFFGEGHTHVGPLVPFLLDHLFAGPVKFVAVVAEVALAAVLVYLLVRESSG